MTEPNGDDSVAAVFLNWTTLRVSIDANYPYPGGSQQNIVYTAEKKVGEHDLTCPAIIGPNDIIEIPFQPRESEHAKLRARARSRLSPNCVRSRYCSRREMQLP